jgi:predicted O-linked N-acetylglucosamine transferase (SPINDLY family)
MAASPPDAAALQALLGQAISLHQQGQLAQADALYAQVLTHQPGQAVAWQLRGVVLAQLGQPEQALPMVEQALALRPDAAEIHNNRGMVLQQLRRFEEAAASHTQAVALKPALLDALNNQGVALAELGRHAQALAAYDAVLAQQPGFANAWSNRGAALRALGRHREAAHSYTQAQALAPGFPYALGHALYAQSYVCDWAGHGAQVAQLQQTVAQGGAGALAAEPFTLLAFSGNPQTLLDNARAFTAAKYPPHAQPLWAGERYTHERIRVAYLSADFHDHATAYLMAEFFERHDSTRFETIAISFGPDRQDGMRQRLRQAFGQFIDVRGHSDAEVAQLLRSLEVDIAVDLKGYTQDCRTGILARRCAPVQVNYLGFPGTMGAPYIDYIVGDATVTPPGCERFYTEHIVRLPHSYQVNDRQRAIAAQTPTRQQQGLPDEGFVFACFNNNYKITPEVFGIWMRLLAQVQGSVLWLLADNDAAPAHLRSEAAARGIDSRRLVFAPRAPLPEHLARHRLADLFLDTLPCNAHTTASDALWAGLPVLTCLGSTFAGRVAASLLTAVGLPELITTSLADYEALALQLATDADRLPALRQKLLAQRLECPLFDTAAFVRSMERAYEEMVRRARAGETHRGLDFSEPNQALAQNPPPQIAT